MKEFIEKLIDRLEEEIQDVSESQSSYEVGSDMSITCSHIMGTLRDVKNRIIPKLAEEYKDKVMINGQYCWQTCSATEHCKKCNRLCNGSIDYYENYDVLAEEYYANTPQKSAGGWISVTERLPDNEYETVLAVSKQEDGYYYFVAVYTSKHGFRTEDCGVYEEPTAWQPLPELYEAEKPAEWKDAVMNHFTKIE